MTKKKKKKYNLVKNGAKDATELTRTRSDRIDDRRDNCLLLLLGHPRLHWCLTH